jgi:hypothetical protein
MVGLLQAIKTQLRKSKQLYGHEMKRMLTIIMPILNADPEFGLTEQEIRDTTTAN